jgi:hypothetical protein
MPASMIGAIRADPYHEFDNPQGLGDTITGFAQFIPWLTDTTSDAHETPSQIADEFSLTAFPNPFNPTTRTFVHTFASDVRWTFSLRSARPRKYSLA